MLQEVKFITNELVITGKLLFITKYNKVKFCNRRSYYHYLIIAINLRPNLMPFMSCMVLVLLFKYL